ncbi:MAG: YqiA/YcfP family alpha/beta fold hydrolase [Pseudomonadota bacterium]
MKVVWSHGQEAGPWGAKSSSLAQTAANMGCEFEALDYRKTPDPELRVEMLVRRCGEIQEPAILAGSSMGGYVSIRAAEQVRVPGIFLLAPALFLSQPLAPGFFVSPPQITLVHGWRDEVIPPEVSIEFARRHRARLHLVDGDHRLKDNLVELNVFFKLFLEGLKSA